MYCVYNVQFNILLGFFNKKKIVKKRRKRMECFYSNNNGNFLVKKNIFIDINILKFICMNIIKIFVIICK